MTETQQTIPGKPPLFEQTTLPARPVVTSQQSRVPEARFAQLATRAEATAADAGATLGPELAGIARALALAGTTRTSPEQQLLAPTEDRSPRELAAGAGDRVAPSRHRTAAHTGRHMVRCRSDRRSDPVDRCRRHCSWFPPPSAGTCLVCSASCRSFGRSHLSCRTAGTPTLRRAPGRPGGGRIIRTGKPHESDGCVNLAAAMAPRRVPTAVRDRTSASKRPASIIRLLKGDE